MSGCVLVSCISYCFPRSHPQIIAKWDWTEWSTQNPKYLPQPVEYLAIKSTTRRSTVSPELAQTPPPPTSRTFSLIRRRWRTDSRRPAGDRRQLRPPHPPTAMAGLKRHHDGKIAGLYDLDKTLGRGHFAVVKLARHVFTGEKVCSSKSVYASSIICWQLLDFFSLKKKLKNTFKDVTLVLRNRHTKEGWLGALMRLNISDSVILFLVDIRTSVLALLSTSKWR